jgi:putative MATE family efflux protein
MTVAQIINLLYSIVDRIYLGHLTPGQDSPALTGIGIAMPVISILMSVASLCGVGGAPLFSIARGSGDEDEAKRVLGNSFTLLLMFGVVLTTLVIAFMRPILVAFGASSVTLPYALEYMRIYTFGTIFVMISLGMNSFINAQGAARRGMLTVALGAIVNIILDPIFIFVFRMETAGAALATIIAQFCSAAWVLSYLCRAAPIRISLSHMRLKLRRVVRILTLGSAGFIMNCTNSLIQVVCNRALRFWGEAAFITGGDIYIGAMTVINSVREIVFAPVQGIAQGASPVLGFNYGAGKHDRVRQAIRFSATVNIGYTFAIWLFIMIAPSVLINIFTDAPGVVLVGVRAMRLYFAMSLFMSLQMTAQQAFTSLGKSGYAIFFSLLRKAFIAAPLTLLLPSWGLGVDGVFIADTISQVIGGISCGLTMYFVVYRRKQLTINS